MGKEQKWNYGTGGLIDLCNGCRFDRNICPVAKGEVEFEPVGPSDGTASIMRKDNYYKVVEGDGKPIKPFVCVIFEPRNT